MSEKVHVFLRHPVLFINKVTVNSLTHLCTNDLIFLRRLGQSENAKINVFHFGHKSAKI